MFNRKIKLTLSSSTLRVIIPSSNPPPRLGVHLDYQHDSQVSPTRRSTLLRPGSQKSGRTASQDFSSGVIIGLFDVSRSDDTELLVSFVVSTGLDPANENQKLILISLHLRPWNLRNNRRMSKLEANLLLALPSNRLLNA